LTIAVIKRFKSLYNTNVCNAEANKSKFYLVILSKISEDENIGDP